MLKSIGPKHFSALLTLLFYLFKAFLPKFKFSKNVYIYIHKIVFKIFKKLTFRYIICIKAHFPLYFPVHLHYIYCFYSCVC